MLTKFRFTIGRKIYVIIALSLIGFLSLTWFSTRQLDLALRDQRRQELKHVVELAVGVAKEEYEASRQGGTPIDQAKKRAAARIGSLRFANSEYIFIIDRNNVNVMHASADLIGRDMSDVKDASGKRFVVEMNEVARRDGGGFVDYFWPKTGSDKPQPKFAYAAAFAPFDWAICTGVFVDDVDHQVWNAAVGALQVAAVMLLLIGAVSIVVARRTSRAMTGMTGAMRQLAEGHLDVVLPGLGRRDEIGEIAAAVEAFKVKAVEKAEREAQERESQARAEAQAKRSAEQHEAAQKKATEEKAAAERTAAMHALADRFEKAVGGIIENVSSASTELEAAAHTLTKTAETTQQLSTVVASASEEASANVQSVASATEEMTGSIGEISRQVQESSTIAGEAVVQAQKTDARIAELSQAASRIGDVVKLITAIAEQTNLLALNATIEAARAGEAGKGFAVVAQEVKALAAQTAKATGEIGTQIAGMQMATQDSVTAIKEIGGTIGRISHIAATIAAAVEEQGAATQEIARNVQEASKGTAQVATNIVSVNRGAGETGSASAQVLSSAQSLASESNHLKAEVRKFLETVRAG